MMIDEMSVSLVEETGAPGGRGVGLRRAELVCVGGGGGGVQAAPNSSRGWVLEGGPGNLETPLGTPLPGGNHRPATGKHRQVGA